VAAVPVLPPRAAGRKGGAAASRWQADHLIDGRQAAHQVFGKVFCNLHKILTGTHSWYSFDLFLVRTERWLYLFALRPECFENCPTLF
jgi:hypothetical protein